MSEERARPSPPGFLTAGIVRHYRLYVLLVLAVLVYGLYTFVVLPRTEDPEFSVGVLRVLTLHPGVGSRQVETLVTRPIEDAIEELDGIETIESTSAGGISLVEIQLESRAIPDEVLAEVKEKVEETRERLPAGVGEPEVYGYNTAEVPVTIVSLLGPPDYALLHRWAERIRDELRTIPEVSRPGSRSRGCPSARSWSTSTTSACRSTGCPSPPSSRRCGGRMPPSPAASWTWGRDATCSRTPTSTRASRRSATP